MSGPDPSSPPLAKACLYYWSTSVWSAVALLAIAQKGYGPDEIDMKIVDINKSENLHPSYLRINPKGGSLFRDPNSTTRLLPTPRNGALLGCSFGENPRARSCEPL